MLRKLLFIAIIFLTVLSCRKRWVYFNVTCYIMNLRETEVLVKTENGDASIVGFFLKPKQLHKYSFADSVIFEYSKTFDLKFNFYTAGEDSSFTTYIGNYTFKPVFRDVDNNVTYMDTGYVY